MNYEVLQKEDGFYVAELMYRPMENAFEATDIENRKWVVGYREWGPFPDWSMAAHLYQLMVMAWRFSTTQSLEEIWNE